MVLRRKSYKAGDEVDSKCTKCKMVLAHTIVAMVGEQIARVQCNTCNGEHAYRAPPSASEATAKKRRAERKASTLERGTRGSASDYDAMTKGRDLSKPVPYSIKMGLNTDDVIEHPTFGVGFVTDLKEGSKAHVLFPEGGRILIYGRA
ncbi:MAG: hypothetical protein H6729_09585 [Deltaproteobacteria bacterium]|nr:hypothetical protein [Deltaproteobacteria bacterium]